MNVKVEYVYQRSGSFTDLESFSPVDETRHS